MGRTALFLVMGVGAAMGYIGFQMYGSSQQAMETQYAYLKYVNARNLARTGVHAALRYYDRENVAPTEGVTTSFNQGTYRIDSLRTSGDTVRMVTTGAYVESTYTMRLTLFRTTRPFPIVNGAMAIRATPLDFTSNGKATIDGRNYNADGTALVGSGDKTGVATWTVSDSQEVAGELPGKLLGSPGVKTDTSTANPADYMDEYVANADIVYGPGTYSSVTWGSATDPKIIVCDAGNDTANFKVKFSGDVEGWGILAVRGSLEVTGNFDFHGLVVIYGTNNVINFTSSGTPQIVGGLIIAGNAGVSVTLNGGGSVGAKVKYSSEALEQARNIGRLRYYTILDWYE
ncbi:MAG: hypothetical protein WD182_02690 [Bacteroidota bacterium]